MRCLGGGVNGEELLNSVTDAGALLCDDSGAELRLSLGEKSVKGFEKSLRQPDGSHALRVSARLAAAASR